MSTRSGLYGEVMAPTQALANAIANCARVGILHGAYPGQVATAGNFASPGTPLELAAGPCCEFTVYHLMEIEDPFDFPISQFTVGNAKTAAPKKTVMGANGHMNGALVNAQNGHEAWTKVAEKPEIDRFVGESEFSGKYWVFQAQIWYSWWTSVLPPRPRSRGPIQKLWTVRIDL